MKIALIDGDILCYRIGFASEEESEKIAKARMEEFLVDMLMELEVQDYEGFLSGDGNFRDRIAVTAKYKGNRSGARPIHYYFLREYLESEWEFRVTEDEEADDAIAIQASRKEFLDNCIVCSIDKDFKQLPGWHYNFVKRELFYVSPSDGLRSFYEQILTGDRADNVIGLRGIGPVKAARMLAGCSTEQEYYKLCIEAYGRDVERVVENGRLLWLRRYPGQLWQPPYLGQDGI